MMKLALLLVISVVSSINCVSGYSYEYGVEDVRGLAEAELLSRLYGKLENKNRQENGWYGGFEGIGSNKEDLLADSEPTGEEKMSPESLVDKTEISKTIEEDQELRRVKNSKEHQTSTRSETSSSTESVIHANGKEKGVGKASEKNLPFYCHPPNPCPKGMTEKDGCLEFVENTAEYQKEWVMQSQKKGLCRCDEEHMFGCQDSIEAMGASLSGGGSAREASELEKMLEMMAKENKSDNPYMKGGQKRQSLVAKKLPRFRREAEYTKMEEVLAKAKRSKAPNPYLEGLHLHTVAKKG